MTKAKRALRTPKQRAELALGLAQRIRDAAKKKADAAEKANKEAARALAEAEAVLVHRQNDPALRDDPQLPLGGGA